MKTWIISLLTVVSLSLSQNVLAGPMYYGIGYGTTNFDSIDLAFDSPPANVSDDEDSAAKIFVGNYLSPGFSWEVAYANLGEYTASSQGNYDVKIKLKALSAAFVAHQNIHPKWEFFAKLGLAYWKTDLDYNDFTNSGSGDKSKWGTLIGLGFNYKVADNWLLGLEWEQYQNVGQSTNVTLPGSALELNGNDLDVLGIRLTYKLRLAPGT